MNEDDLALRNLTYARFAELGRAPTAAEIATAAGGDRAEVIASWERLHAQHALVLDPVTSEIRMANPFSGVPTGYRVQAAGRCLDPPVLMEGGADPECVPGAIAVKTFIVLQVKTMSSHHRAARTRQWKSKLWSSGR